LTTELSGAQASLDERQREQAALEARQHELAAELNNARAAVESGQDLQAALEERQAQLVQVTAERAAALARVDEGWAERRRLEAQLQDAEQRCQRLAVEVNDAQAIAEENRRLEVALEEAQVQFTQAVDECAAAQAGLESANAGRREIATRLSEAEALHAQLLTELADAKAAAELGPRMAAEFEAERARWHESAELRDAQHRAELARESADQQRLHVLLDLASQQHQELRARLQEAEQQCRECQTQLNQVIEERRSAQSQLQTLESLHEAESAGHAAERERLEQLAATAEAARDRHAEAVVNREVVLSALAEHSRRLTPLVTTGRVARELAPELRELVERVDDLAGQVLGDCHLDQPGRADLELLRAEVVRAGALTSELLRAGAVPDSTAQVPVERRRKDDRS
jgi:flagellar biosynthesis chaperone FliJ